MEYEYCIKYINKKTGKCTGHGSEHYKTHERAVLELIHCRPSKGEKAVIVKREVGEWKEVDDV